MRVEVVAVGTELLLGQIADTNGAWLGERLAANGIASHFHQVVGDNHGRIVLAMRTALARSDAVIVCGGLGPTQDDITRSAIAEVMNVPLERDDTIVERIRGMFSSRGREMPANNALQADVPRGASVIPQRLGTAPGLICPVGHKVLYAVPGVPYEMQDMFARGILPDLEERMAEAGEVRRVFVSRTLRTWGLSESALAEVLAGRLEALDAAPERGVTLAFLASGMEGIKVRITAAATDEAAARSALDAEEAEVRAVLDREAGDVVFGVDAEAIEDAVARGVLAVGGTLAVAESLTGGLVASRLVNVEGASAWFRGGVVSYASEVKFSLLGVEPGPVVSEAAARAMAAGVRERLGASIGLSVTGVAGPAEQDGRPVGTVVVGVSRDGHDSVHELMVPGDRMRIRQYAAVSALDALRRNLSAG